MSLKFPVYVIYSKWSLDQIREFLKDFGEAEYLRIVYEMNLEENKLVETNRTIAILSDDIYKKLEENGYTCDTEKQFKGFKIKPFILKDKNLESTDPIRTLFIPIPTQFHHKHDKIFNFIERKLKDLEDFGILEQSSWSINIPVKTREKGDIKNGCYISFGKDVELERIAMTKILLTDTYWPEMIIIHESTKPEITERKILKCRWFNSKTINSKTNKTKVKTINAEQPINTEQPMLLINNN